MSPGFLFLSVGQMPLSPFPQFLLHGMFTKDFAINPIEQQCLLYHCWQLYTIFVSSPPIFWFTLLIIWFLLFTQNFTHLTKMGSFTIYLSQHTQPNRLGRYPSQMTHISPWAAAPSLLYFVWVFYSCYWSRWSHHSWRKHAHSLSKILQNGINWCPPGVNLQVKVLSN